MQGKPFQGNLWRCCAIALSCLMVSCRSTPYEKSLGKWVSPSGKLIANAVLSVHSGLGGDEAIIRIQSASKNVVVFRGQCSRLIGSNPSVEWSGESVLKITCQGPVQPCQDDKTVIIGQSKVRVKLVCVDRSAYTKLR